MRTPSRRFTAALALAALGATGARAAPALAEPPRGQVVAPGVGYAAAIRLAHQPDRAADGELLLAFEEDGMDGVPLYRSTDDGRTWRLLRHVTDAAHAGDATWQLRWQPALVELSRAAGSLPAGTLLLSANATRNSTRGQVVEEHLQVYASHDRGRTWRYLSDIVDGGGRPEDVDNRGVWEPDIRVLPDGRLVAYYSSEQHKHEGYNQLLAHKVSSDGGRTWGPEHVDVARPGEVERPGMADVEAAAHGRYVMSYEDIDGPQNGQVHLKWSNDALDWGDPADRGTPVRTAAGGWPSASPIVRWIDDGSREGVLVVLAQHSGGTGDRMGDSLYWNADGGRGPWWEAPAPVRKLTGNIHAGWTQAFMPTADGRAFLHVTSSASPAAPEVARDNLVLSARAPLPFDRYEAEDAVRSGAVQIYSAAASNGSKLRVEVGGQARFPVVLGHPGAGRLRLRYADVNRPANPAIMIDGRLVTAKPTRTMDTDGWTLLEFAIPPLAPGAHEVAAAAHDHAFDLDWAEVPTAYAGAVR